MRLISQDDLSNILNVNTTTVEQLVKAGKIPYKKAGDRILFCLDTIDKWIERPEVTMDHEKFIERYKKRIQEKYPEQLKEIQKFGEQFADPWNPKKFYLNKVKNKKLVFVYYVRYLENGKLVPSSWCTHTNDIKKAEKFAIANRDILLSRYYAREVKKPYFDIYSILKKYYTEDSIYLQIDKKRGRSICDKARRKNHNFIIKKFIPHLRKERVKEAGQIDAPMLSRFQNYLLSDKVIKGESVPGIKPQTINSYLSQVSLIFDNLIQDGHVTINPFKSLLPLRIKQEHKKARGCYEVNKLKGVFNKKWNNEFSYLLSLVIYTTDMRNSEIEKIQVKDLIKIDDINFIDIPESKSKNGVRIVPLHDFVYKKIMAYVHKNDMNPESNIFRLPKCNQISGKRYKEAYLELAEHTGYTVEQLEAENITFYSGRHFWKTLMNSENLGDAEEYFMGHKVSADVSKRYNHRDKQGKKKLLEKTRKVFQILDKYIFKQ